MRRASSSDGNLINEAREERKLNSSIKTITTLCRAAMRFHLPRARYKDVPVHTREMLIRRRKVLQLKYLTRGDGVLGNVLD
jgi:hypothetical protein